MSSRLKWSTQTSITSSDHVKGTLKAMKVNIPTCTLSKSTRLRPLVQVQAKYAISINGYSRFESCDQLGDYKVKGIDLRSDDIDEDSSNCN
jgi:hypothetical protein